MLPDSIPESLWAEFRLHRKKLKAPMTDHAETLILCKLEKWRLENNANPIDVINESIEKGWRGVFLNGHGRSQIPDERSPYDLNDRPERVCCLCGSPLTSGWVYSAKGRKCHAC